MALTFLRRPPKPTREEILAWKSDWREWHGKRIAQHKRDEKYYDLTFTVPAPEGKEPLIVPTGRMIVDELVSHVAAEIPVISVLPRNQNEREQKAAGRRTQWANGAWQRLDLMQILRAMLIHDAVRGCHVVRFQYDPTAWPLRPLPPEAPEEPEDIVTRPNAEFLEHVEALAAYNAEREEWREERDAWDEWAEEHMPIRVDVIDPMFCYWEPVADPQKMIVTAERTVAQIKRDCPAAEDALEGIADTTKVEWNVYADAYYHAQWIETAQAKTVKYPMQYQAMQQTSEWITEPTAHHLGFFPYQVDGPWRTPYGDADKQWPSIYFPIRSVIQYESTLATMIAHIIRTHGWAPLIITSDRAAVDEQKPIIDMTPGYHNYLQSDESARYLEFGGQTLGSLESLVRFVDQYIQQGSGLADVLKGTAKGRSGYQQAQLASMARVALVPVEQVIRRFLERGTRHLFKLVRVIDEPVTVFGGHDYEDNVATLRPEEAVKVGPIKVQLKTILPIDESAKIQNYMAMNKQGWLSAVSAARLAGIENPEDEHARWTAEQVAQQQQIVLAMGKLYAEEHWPELMAMMQAEQEKAAQQQGAGVGGGGRPPGTGGPTVAGRGRPGPPPAGGAQQAAQVMRQAKQGGATPKRLARGTSGSPYEVSTAT